VSRKTGEIDLASIYLNDGLALLSAAHSIFNYEIQIRPRRTSRIYRWLLSFSFPVLEFRPHALSA
jgi:hypothetical protein